MKMKCPTEIRTGVFRLQLAARAGRRLAVACLAMGLVACAESQWSVRDTSSGYLTVVPPPGYSSYQVPYAPLSGGGYGAGAISVGQSQPPNPPAAPGVGSVTSSGSSITATFTWTGSGDAPSCVIVEETGAASFRGNVTSGGNVIVHGGVPADGQSAGSCSDGFDQIWTPNTYGGSASCTKFTVVNNPGSPFSMPACTPAATGNMTVIPPSWPPQLQCAMASVSYSATAYPADIILTGGIGDNDSQQYLVGQQLTATLSCSPLTATSYAWSVDGGAPFSAFTITGSDYITTGHWSGVPPSTLTSSTYVACFSKASDSVKLSLTAGVAAPDGGTGPVTLTKRFSTVLPDFVVQAVSPAGQLQLTASPGWSYSGSFDRGDGTQWAFGVRASLQIPQAFQDGGYTGYWDWAQILTMNYTRTVGGVAQRAYCFYGATDYYTGHDHPFPYSTVWPAYDQNLLHLTEDEDHWIAADGIRGVGDNVVDTFDKGPTQYCPNDAFQDYAMFVPSGAGSQHVPLFESDWGYSGVFNYGTQWTMAPNPVCKTPTQNSNPGFPDWSYMMTTLWLWK